MSSNNNPTPTTPVPNLSKVTIGTTQYELNHLSIADAQKLYAALGTTGTSQNYQQLADQVAAVVRNYQSIISLDLPSDMDPQEAIKQLFESVKKGGGKLADNSPEWMKKSWAKVQELPILHGMFGTAEGIVDAGNILYDFFGGIKKGVTLLPNLASVSTQGLVDGKNYIDGKLNPISEEQAKAIGTAYAAAMYQAMDAPNAPAETKRPNLEDASIVQKAWAWVQANADALWHWLPPGITTFLATIPKWFMNGFDWDKASAEAKKESEEYHSKETLTYEERLEKNLTKKVHKDARASTSQILAQVEDVAGVKTQNLATLVKDGGIYRDNDGQWNSLTFDERTGAPQTNVIKDDKGQPMTSSAQNAEVAKNKLVPQNISQLAGEGVGAFVMIKGSREFARGFMSKVVGENSRLMNNLEGSFWGKVGFGDYNKLEKATELYNQSVAMRADREVTTLGIKRTIKADPVKADALLNKAKEMVKGINVEAVEENTVKAMAREKLVGTRVVEFAESETKGIFTKKPVLGKAFNWVGKQAGSLTDRLVIRPVESMVNGVGNIVNSTSSASNAHYNGTNAPVTASTGAPIPSNGPTTGAGNLTPASASTPAGNSPTASGSGTTTTTSATTGTSGTASAATSAEEGAAQGLKKPLAEKIGTKIGNKWAEGWSNLMDSKIIAKAGGNTKVIENGVEVALKETSFLTKFGPLARGFGRAIPVAGTVLGSAEDISGTYTGIRDGNNQQAIRSGVRAGAGMAGGWAGAEGGAAAGAAIGVWFGGVGAVPGAFIGGVLGGISGYFGARWGAGKIADMATENVSTGKSVEMDPGLAAAMNDPRVIKTINEHPEMVTKLHSTDAKIRMQTAQQLAQMSGYRLFTNGAQVSVGAVIPGSTAPVAPAAVAGTGVNMASISLS